MLATCVGFSTSTSRRCWLVRTLGCSPKGHCLYCVSEGSDNKRLDEPSASTSSECPCPHLFKALALVYQMLH